MHSCATSKIRESRPEHPRCICSSTYSAALVSGRKHESKNLANHHRQAKPAAHRSHNNRLSTSKPCYYCGIYVNLDPEKMESVLCPQLKSHFKRLTVWELKMSNCFVTPHLSQRMGIRRNDKQKDKSVRTMERGHAYYLCECLYVSLF